MNMKKSIAGVMAGAMAVSAMAATVSADQDAISLTYDLKTYVNDVNKDAAKVTVVANYEGSLITEESIKAQYITFGADNGYVRSGNIYNKNGVKLGEVKAKGDWSEDVKNTAANSGLVEFEFTARPYKDIVNNVEEKYQTFKATADAKNVDGAYYDKALIDEISYYNMKICTSGNDTIGKFDLRKYDVLSLGYSTVETVKAAGLDKLLGYTEKEQIKTPAKPGEVTGVEYYMIGTAGEKVPVTPYDYDLKKCSFNEGEDYIFVPEVKGDYFNTDVRELVRVKDDSYVIVRKVKDNLDHDDEVVKTLEEYFSYFDTDENGNVKLDADGNPIKKVDTKAIESFKAGIAKYKFNFAKDTATMLVNDKIVTLYRQEVKTPDVAEEKETVQIPKLPTPGTYAVRDAVAKLTYKIPNTVNLNKANGWGWDVKATAEDINNVSEKYFYSTLTGDVTMSAETFAGGFFDAAGTKKGMIKPATALASTPTTVAVGAFKEGASAEAVIPFKSTLKPKSTTWKIKNSKGVDEEYLVKENDVIWALQSRKAGGNFYTRPVAVINDAIANHDNVVFTFTSYNGYVGTEKSHFMNQWVNVDQGYTYETSGKGYDWHNPTFGQHLYTNVKDSYSLFDSDEYDMYGSYSSAWGINLFTGAVVVNKDLTMQLSDTDTFNWGNNTLSFDWFDIIDEGKITDAKTFLTSMLLYTPVDWYWDSLTVVVSDEEDEAVDAGEGLDGEGEVIEDEEPEVVEEEPEVEIEEEPEVVETEAAPVETAPSPATGNAPVALAVIPVALAAAAVVAKKRG